MVRYLTKKILRYVITFLVALSITFFVLRVMPADPVSLIAGPNITKVEREAMESELGLDKPLSIQYMNYIKKILTLDLGISFSSKRSISEMISERLPWTLLLVIIVLFICLLLAIPLGIYLAINNGKSSDRIISGILVILMSIFTPSLGLLLLYIFGVKMPIFPIGGSQTPGVVLCLFDRFLDIIRHLVLPVLTLVLINIPRFTFYIKSAYIQLFSEDYIVALQSKGVSSFRILFLHGIKNISLPLITVVGLWIGSMVRGSILVETVFSYPGIGRLVYDAILIQDYPVIEGVFIITTFVVLVISFLLDILYVILNPKLKRGAWDE